MLNILASVSQWEREAIGERTKTALTYKRRRGERVGHVPSGWRVADDGTNLEHADEEQGVLRQLRNLRASGLSVRAVAQELNQGGAFNRGNHWTKSAVHRIAQREAA